MSAEQSWAGIGIRLKTEMDAEGDCAEEWGGTGFSQSNSKAKSFLLRHGVGSLCKRMKFPFGNVGNPRGFVFQDSCVTPPVTICLPSVFLSSLCKLCK